MAFKFEPIKIIEHIDEKEITFTSFTPSNSLKSGLYDLVLPAEDKYLKPYIVGEDRMTKTNN